MNKIVGKHHLSEEVWQMEIVAPHIAEERKAGQFIILRVDDAGERIPLTVAGTDKERGTVTIIFQKVGYTTKHLDMLNEQLTREPFPMPKLVISDRVPEFAKTGVYQPEWLGLIEPGDFSLEGYQHHAPMTAPMAV